MPWMHQLLLHHWWSEFTFAKAPLADAGAGLWKVNLNPVFSFWGKWESEFNIDVGAAPMPWKCNEDKGNRLYSRGWEVRRHVLRETHTHTRTRAQRDGPTNSLVLPAPQDKGIVYWQCLVGVPSPDPDREGVEVKCHPRLQGLTQDAQLRTKVGGSVQDLLALRLRLRAIAQSSPLANDGNNPPPSFSLVQIFRAGKSVNSMICDSVWHVFDPATNDWTKLLGSVTQQYTRAPPG
jgi:hypothetical protein